MQSEAWKILDELTELSKHQYVSPYDIAAVYAALGEKDQAFERLQTAYETRDVGLRYLKVDPAVDNLRDDPRFDDLLRRIGLEP